METPLAICTMLLVALGAFVAIAYVAVRRSSLHTADERLRYRGAVQALTPTTRPERLAASELRDPGGRRLLAIGDTSRLPDEAVLDAMPGRDSGAVGPFTAAGNSLVLPTVVPVMAGSRRVRYLVEWRFVTASAERKFGHRPVDRSPVGAPARKPQYRGMDRPGQDPATASRFSSPA